MGGRGGKRVLSDGERVAWLGARKQCEDKEKEYSNMLRQKSRFRWDVEGDENSKFFHLHVRRRNNECNLRGLVVNGLWCEDSKIIKAGMARHYKNLFFEGGKTRLVFCSNKLEEISIEEARMLEIEFSEKEVWEAICSCGGDKAPGPDGKMMVSMGCNASFVTIIPKVPDPIGLGNFRLIGCYYKIIAKLLAERVKRVVRKVEGEVQNAFIKGRFIVDGVLIANETMESSSMSNLVNGSSPKEFGLERGLDKAICYPFLFILAAKGLNAIVTEVVEKDIFRGVVVGASNVTVSHLQYAYDTIFLENGIRTMLNLLCAFSNASKREFPFTYLGLPIGENMRRVNAWAPVVEKFKNRGLNIGSLRAKNLALLGKWWWRFRREGGSLWVKMIESIHGTSGGLGEVRALYGRRIGRGVWSDIVRIGEEIDGMGIEFSSSYVGELGDGRDIRFWLDKWVDNQRLYDRFHRLYHLDQRKEGSVLDNGSWSLGEDGEFTVKELARLVEEKILHMDSGGHETLWNKLVPKKANIFVWRALKGRLLVCVELDRRGIDLDSVLCPSCNDIVETCAHCLVTCDLVMNIWERVFSWWKVGCVNAFSIDEFFSSNGGINMTNYISRVWQAVIWSTGYFIWKEINACVFGNKVSSTNKIVQDIQLKSFEWIVRRSIKYKGIDWQKWLREPLKVRLQ
ncbi:reverse transcriptase domain, reverse transcriptase zinc-binding domain protein [Tanacetum coccineum]|uniref:Reverse transcriptase domain, reverse transcriptase zinc-binding domain protein n=1 Tax=Tanacetum coccineum TaxID=301880 RepID=A0ABQ4WBR1_9ASTR